MILIFNFLSSTLTMGQSNIIVNIIDSSSSENIEGVTVRIDEIESVYKTTTKEQGFVYFRGIPGNRVITVFAHKPGYIKFHKTIQLLPNQESVTVELRLDPDFIPVHILGKIENQNKLPVEEAKVVLRWGNVFLVDSTDKDGIYDFIINQKDADFPDVNINFYVSNCHTKEVNYLITKKDLDVIKLYKRLTFGLIKLDCQENIDVIYDKFAIEWSNNPSAIVELRRGAPFFFDNSSSKFRPFVREIISKSETAPTSKSVICPKILIDDLNPLKGAPDVFGSFSWRDNIYHKSLGRFNYLPKSTSNLPNETVTEIAYEKFCSIAELLIGAGAKFNSDSTYLEKLLKVEGPLDKYLKPTLVFIGFKKTEKGGKSTLLMFRYPAYNLSDNDLRDYDIENRIWWKAATDGKNTIIFDENIGEYKCGLTYPYPDIRGFMSRTFWCTKSSKNETIVFGFDFSLYPKQ